MQCDYCQEEATYRPIIMKPMQFVFENKRFSLAKITNKSQDNICLKCLQEEIDHIKDCY
jgi:hypothetical protein